MKQKFYRADAIRYRTRCPRCGAVVRGKPRQFRLSDMLGKVVFQCPVCTVDSIVEIKSLVREELVFEIQHKEE